METYNTITYRREKISKHITLTRRCTGDRPAEEIAAQFLKKSAILSSPASERRKRSCFGNPIMKRMDALVEPLSVDSVSASSSPRSVVHGKASSVYDDPLHSVKWEESGFSRVKLMCSFGGRIIPRPHDNQLRYVGGETRIVVVSRNVTFSELSGKLCRLVGSAVNIKYQLPSEDLDALISVTSDEDLDNMMEEHDRLPLFANRSTARLRLFLFPNKLEKSLSDVLDCNPNRESWFLDALNGMPVLSRMRSETSSILSEVPDYLFGLDVADLADDQSAPAVAANFSQFVEQSAKISSSHHLQNASVQEESSSSAAVLQSSGEISSAPGSPLQRMLTRGSASSAPPVMTTMLSAIAVAALKGELQTKQGVDNNVVAEDGHSQLVQEPASDQKNVSGDENQLKPISTGIITTVSASKNDRPSDQDPMMMDLPAAEGSSDQVMESTSSSAKRGGTHQRHDPQQESRPMGRMVYADKSQNLPESTKMKGLEDDPWIQMPMDSAEAASQAPKLSGESRTTKEKASAEASQPARTSSPGPPPYSFLPPALSQQMPIRPQVPDVVMPAFYQISSDDETALYATQGPAIQLPVFSPLANPVPPAITPQIAASKPDTAPASGFVRMYSPVSRSPSPPMTYNLSPQQQLLGLPRTASPPPPTHTVAPMVYSNFSNTAAPGVPVNSPLLQLQRQVSDPIPQSQTTLLPIPHRDLNHAAATYIAPSPTAALPPRFRGQPVFFHQQAQPVPFDKRPSGQRQAPLVPPHRSPLAPSQYNYYNMEQVTAYPATSGVQGVAISEPPNAMYMIDPNSFGGVPSEAAPSALQFAGAGNPFKNDLHSTQSDVSGLVRVSDQQQPTVGENRVQAGRQL